MSHVELLVLDGQGVVFSDPLVEFFAALADETAQDPVVVRTRWNDLLREPAWRGTISDETLWHGLSEGRGHGWGERLESAYGPGPAAPALARWSSVVPIWLLTNHRTPWIEARLDRLELRRWFTRVLVSDAVGALKPERAVFDPILRHVRHPASVLLVDDQAKNVEAAAALGFCALLADSSGRWLDAVDGKLGLL